MDFLFGCQGNESRLGSSPISLRVASILLHLKARTTQLVTRKLRTRVLAIRPKIQELLKRKQMVRKLPPEGSSWDDRWKPGKGFFKIRLVRQSRMVLLWHSGHNTGPHPCRSLPPCIDLSVGDFPLAGYERTETLIRHSLNSVYVSSFKVQK